MIVPMMALSAALMRRMWIHSFESFYNATYPYIALYTGFAPMMTVACHSSDTATVAARPPPSTAATASGT